MLRKYYRLQFFIDDFSPKGYQSNIQVRKANADGTPKQFKYENGRRIEVEEGGRYEYFPLFFIRKYPGTNLFDLVVHNRKEGRCFYPVKKYSSPEEAFFAAREIWYEMDADLVDDDVKLIDHVLLYKWMKTTSVDKFIKKNNCRNVKISTTYQGKTLVEWDNYDAAM